MTKKADRDRSKSTTIYPSPAVLEMINGKIGHSNQSISSKWIDAALIAVKLMEKDPLQAYSLLHEAHEDLRKIQVSSER